jgi:RimJ/RimL family protein N-acetyltransferase
MNLQPLLTNDVIRIIPIQSTDFEKLFAVACDPLIWEQHPNKDRYKREVFENFFKGALESGGAFLVYDTTTNEVIGSSRFYDFNEVEKSVIIGYTFLARSHWGTTYNRSLKTLMLNYAFGFTDKVHFVIGSQNIRSQTAIGRLGAKKIDEQIIAYYGEPEKLNFIYEIKREDFI